MGCDIWGWIEVKEFENSPNWSGVIKISHLAMRNYNMFGCLFGVRNYANFAPIAKSRGIPSDVGIDAQNELQEMSDDAHSHTWITYKEIQNIDWNEKGEACDERIHQYSKKGIYETTYGSSSELTEKDLKVLHTHKVLEKNNKIYKLEKIKRNEALSKNWELLFKMMGDLAGIYKPENVRLVVWFDN